MAGEKLINSKKITHTQCKSMIVSSRIGSTYTGCFFPSPCTTILLQQIITRHRCCIKQNQDLHVFAVNLRPVS